MDVRAALESGKPFRFICEKVFDRTISGVHGAALARELIDSGADINADNGDPLNAASRLGATEVALALLDAGAKIDGKGQFGETALHWAAGTGNAVLVRRLLEGGAPTNAKDWRSRTTPLEWARHAMAKAASADVANVIAALEPTTREGVLKLSLPHVIRAGVVASALSLPMIPIHGYAVTPIDGWRNVVVFVFGISLLPALLAAAGSIPFLFFRHTRKRALAAFAFSGTTLVVLMTVALVSEEVRSNTFRDVAERAEPLIAAVEAHVRDTGAPPATIQDLVPRYLPAIPSGLPNITIAAGDTAPARVMGNDWILEADVSTGLVNFDKFVYFPNQLYGAPGADGSLDLIGKWAYVRDRQD